MNYGHIIKKCKPDNFDNIDKIDKILAINPSVVFVFADFNVHHNDWLAYPGGTDRLVNCSDFFISNDLTQTVNTPTDYDFHSPALLDVVFLVFVLQRFSLHWETRIMLLSVSINFPSNSKRDAPFHRIANNYSHADWDGLLKNVPLENIFKLSASATASEFCEWV